MLYAVRRIVNVRVSGGFRGGDGGTEKSASNSKNQSPFRGASPDQPKPNDFGRKISLNFGEDLFFFFFGDHLIQGGKNV